MRRWIGPGTFISLFAISVVCLGIAASSTGVAVGESVHMNAANTIGVWFNRIGLGETSFFDQASRDAAWAAVHSDVTLPTLLSAFVWHVATSGYQWWGALLSLRLGYVLIAALSVPLLYALIAPAWGRRSALIASAFLAFVPRAMHQAVLADPEAVTVTGWLLVLVAYARARRARSCSAVWAWSLAAGLGLGLAVAASHGALVVLVVLAVHTLWAERRSLRGMLRDGHVPVPAVLLPAFVLAPMVWYVSTPWLWHDAANRIRPMFLAAFTASAGADRDSLSYVVISLITSVPAVTLFAAALGLAVVVGPGRVKRWACDEDALGDNGEGALIVLGLLVAVLWPWIVPASLRSSPPRWLVAVPFVAALAAVGMHRSLNEVSMRLQNRRRALRIALPVGIGGICLAVPLIQTLSHPATRSAAFTPLSGGPAWIAGDQRIPLHDGSPAVALIPAIDSIGPSNLSVFGPEVPIEVWLTMRRRGMLRTNLRAARRAIQADLLLIGREDDEVREMWSVKKKGPKLIAKVERDGVVLLSLYETSVLEAERP